MHECEDHRSALSECILQEPSTLFLLIHGLALGWGSPIQLAWLAIKPSHRDPPDSTSSALRLQAPRLSFRGLWVLGFRLRPHVCTASTLFTKLSLWLHAIVFNTASLSHFSPDPLVPPLTCFDSQTRGSPTTTPVLICFDSQTQTSPFTSSLFLPRGPSK